MIRALKLWWAGFRHRRAVAVEIAFDEDAISLIPDRREAHVVMYKTAGGLPIYGCEIKEEAS